MNHPDTPPARPRRKFAPEQGPFGRGTDKSPTCFSRRRFLGTSAAIAAGFAAGRLTPDWLPFINPDEHENTPEKTPTPPPGRPSDILVESDKFTSYVEQYDNLATELSTDENFPLPYEAFLAVSMHESDSGTSELAVQANNFFGVIAKDGWSGPVYKKPTEEHISYEEFDALKEIHPDIDVVNDNGNGSLRVRYSRPFRQYATPEESFRDFAKKVYHQNVDGTYRYADVVEYLKSGGKDPYTIINLLSDSDSEGELRYATGPEWRTKVPTYISLIQKITGVATDDHRGPEVTLPEKQGEIKIDSINFSEFSDEDDEAVKQTMIEAFKGMNKQEYEQYITTIKDVSVYTRDLFGDEKYARYFGDRIPPEKLSYLVIHLWAIGVQTGGRTGNSHDEGMTLSRLMQSWKNSDRGLATQFLLSDNSDAEMWRTTTDSFGRTGHVGYGIQDIGAETHPNADNDNSIGIEVQADTIFDVSSTQFKAIAYWSIDMLLKSGKISKGMDRTAVDKAVDNTVIGHGKNEGLEFGYKYTRPLVQAIQQFAYIAING